MQHEKDRFQHCKRQTTFMQRLQVHVERQREAKASAHLEHLLRDLSIELGRRVAKMALHIDELLEVVKLAVHLQHTHLTAIPSSTSTMTELLHNYSVRLDLMVQLYN
jgi:hypothetical protein